MTPSAHEIWALLRSGFKVNQIAGWYRITPGEVVQLADRYASELQKKICAFVMEEKKMEKTWRKLEGAG